MKPVWTVPVLVAATAILLWLSPFIFEKALKKSELARCMFLHLDNLDKYGRKSWLWCTKSDPLWSKKSD